MPSESYGAVVGAARPHGERRHGGEAGAPASEGPEG